VGAIYRYSGTFGFLSSLTLLMKSAVDEIIKILEFKNSYTIYALKILNNKKV
jgi:hypothetical protein